MLREAEGGLGKFHRDADKAKAAFAKHLSSGLETFRKLYGDIPRQEAVVKGGKPQETTLVTEQFALRESFTDAEREALIADGAVVYTPKGETIPAQKEDRIKKGKPSFWYVVEAGDLVSAVPSKHVEFAIYPQPDRAFVPGSFNKSIDRQEERVAADTAELRKRTGQEGISEIIPDEASTVTDIVFQHEEATGEWLLGSVYAKAQGLDWVYTRTKNTTNSTGSCVARVGGADPDSGVHVRDWYRDRGSRNVGVLRMVVPIETQQLAS